VRTPRSPQLIPYIQRTNLRARTSHILGPLSSPAL
jgi:hypothetical protein